MRRTQMPRPTKPLARYTPLSAVSPRREAAAKAAGKRVTSTLTSRRRPAISPEVRALIVARSEGRCEMRLVGCQVQGVDPSHRKAVGSGGRHGDAETAHNVASNYLWACRACHDYCHARPGFARDARRGYFVAGTADPATVPVLYRRRRLVLLDDAGGKAAYEPPTEELAA